MPDRLFISFIFTIFLQFHLYDSYKSNFKIKNIFKTKQNTKACLFHYEISILNKFHKSNPLFECFKLNLNKTDYNLSINY